MRLPRNYYKRLTARAIRWDRESVCPTLESCIVGRFLAKRWGHGLRPCPNHWNAERLPFHINNRKVDWAMCRSQNEMHLISSVKNRVRKVIIWISCGLSAGALHCTYFEPCLQKATLYTWKLNEKPSCEPRSTSNI